MISPLILFFKEHHANICVFQRKPCEYLCFSLISATPASPARSAPKVLPQLKRNFDQLLNSPLQKKMVSFRRPKFSRFFSDLSQPSQPPHFQRKPYEYLCFSKKTMRIFMFFKENRVNIYV